MLSNLRDNAARYSPAGSTITFGATCTAERATFTVRDEGIGIASADLDRLFEPFFPRGQRRVSAPGTGLGLHPLSSRWWDQLGGTIEVSSTLGAGTTFVVTLPLDRPRSVRQRLTPSHQPHPLASPIRRALSRRTGGR
ncbi:MAG: ATP-binding protein [Anaerolineae bacterium]|nr:ATP-binding protein [Anaerolineae bacterium]